MSSNPFFTKYGVVVGNTSANSVILNSNGLTQTESLIVNGAVNATSVLSNTANFLNNYYVGNSTVNVTANSSTLTVATKLTVGNSTVNVTTNSTSFSPNTASVFGDGYWFFGNTTSNVSANVLAMRVGNTTVNTQLSFSALSINGTEVVNNTTHFIGNSTVNTVINSSAIVINGGTSANSTVVNTNIFFVGNSTVNAIGTQTSYALANSTVSSNLQVGQLSIGANLAVNTTAMFVGNSTVNAIVNSLSVVAPANTSQYLVGTSNLVNLTPGVVWATMAEVTLTDAPTIAIDMSLGTDFVATLGANRTLGAPTNAVVGKRGRIRIMQDGTGSRTLAYNAVWDFAGGTAPTLSTPANSRDYLDYDCITTSLFRATLSKAWS